ncbi:DivIVA domain-containing protein [Thermodesulfovibrionales bacterium]|nr:DivIVA domain-containing protein [Thermodesulfovibrionales bacterium]MCL0034040.1 DivIVA domain-containing protein [Thermodesulfovibrionales bacterium]MCL0062501.1 DivIVA domain-containing protein [Thermodesulfovibrionales bacterium]MCL0068661.1 DivIVA domain-containing protein [Thermodesulfovibrionales bacterium]MCL0072264.1 DivIVA domain-containing protein [Thermodesulfovibrionales bacterium]
MRITPLDIQQKQFPIKFRGFNVDEVYSFLEMIREDLEDILRENASLKEQLSRADEQLSKYRDIESTLRETLVTTQQIVEDYKRNAKKEADLIKKEAEFQANDMIRDAQEKVVKIHEDIVDMKVIRRHFKEEVKRLIESHLRMIEFDKEREGEEIK